MSRRVNRAAPRVAVFPVWRVEVVWLHSAPAPGLAAVPAALVSARRVDPALVAQHGHAPDQVRKRVM
jgi:hypothetical protein